MKNSTSQLTTEEYKILPLLAKYIKENTKNGGKVKNANIRTHFKQMFSVGDTRRRIQLMIHELRVTGKVKNLLASTDGYYVSRKKADKDAYKVALKRRINSLTEVYNSIA